MLSLWMADLPSIGITFAREIGKLPPDGVQSVIQYWDEYHLQFDPPLNRRLLLSGRDEHAKRIRESLIAGIPGSSSLQADSSGESVAFICAAVLDADGEMGLYLRARTLFLTSRAAAQTIGTTRPLNLVLAPELSSFGPALGRIHQVITAIGSDETGARGDSLQRMTTRDFAAGLVSMGLKEEEAYRLARTCGRSVTVLSRIISSNIRPRPGWHAELDLVPVMLCGAWDAANDDDRLVISALAGRAYEEIDATARRLSAHSDAPLDLENSVWSMRSPIDAFTLLGVHVTTALQHRFATACHTVFAEIDQTLANVDRTALPTRGSDFRHSEWLRRGLARSLLLMSGLSEAARFKPIGESPEGFVARIVGSLPGLKSDPNVMISLKAELPALMEAAPVPLASALKNLLEGGSKDLASVFFQDGAAAYPWSSSSPHTYLLWALERIAWAPEYLLSATHVLLLLTALDPGGKLSNRPLASLTNIYLAWMPNTSATLNERQGILTELSQLFPDEVFALLLKLMPQYRGFSTGTDKPHVRDFGSGGYEPVTGVDLSVAYETYTALAVSVATDNSARLAALLGCISTMRNETRDQVVLLIHNIEPRLNEPDRVGIWNQLNAVINKHESFPDADWTLDDAALRPLRALLNQMTPRNPETSILWLFNEYIPSGLQASRI